MRHSHNARRACTRPKTAFTLVELLVVIAIIALLAAILFPVLGRVREAGRRTVCLSNMKQIGSGMLMYISDHGERLMPFMAGQGPGMTFGSLTDPGDLPQGAGIKLATYSENPSTPAERYIIDVYNHGYHYYSYMDLIHKYTQNVEIWQCPSLSKGRDLSKTTPPFSYQGGSRPEAFGGIIGDNKNISWPPSYNMNAGFGGINVGGGYLPMASIPTPSQKIFLVHHPRVYPPNAGDVCRELLIKTDSLSVPHFDGTVILWLDGHAKWYSREHYLKKFTRGGPPSGLYADANNTNCGTSGDLHPPYWDRTTAATN